MSKRNLEIISCDIASDLPVNWPDVYYSPSYGKASALMDGGEWMVARWADGRIIFPFIKRKIPDELTDGEEWFDVVSPYGYSGTALVGDCSTEEFLAFRDALVSVLHRERCVAEFQRQGSFVPCIDIMMLALGGSQLRHTANTLMISLAGGHEAAFARYEGRARTKVRKAIKLGYSWSCRSARLDDAAANSTFRNLYTQTMLRLEAAPYYFFGDDYFRTLITGLLGRIYVYEVKDALGIAKVAGIFFVWDDTLHLHLVGSDPESLRDGAGNLGYDGLVQWACQQRGCRRLHVGGGVNGEDSLYEFKRSFGGEPVPFFSFSNIINDEIYDVLCRRRAEAGGLALADIKSHSFFPQYRMR